MTDDELLARIRSRAVERGAARPLPAAASLADLAAEERALGFALPPFYVRLVTEIANGGFGPSELTGIGPNGFPHPDHGLTLADAYKRVRAYPEHSPRYLVPLHSWGCGKTSELDCATSEGAIVTSEWLGTQEEGVGHWRTCASIREWMREWLERTVEAGVDLTEDVIGHETRKNPFTGKPETYAITRPRGEQLDLTARCLPGESLTTL